MKLYKSFLLVAAFVGLFTSCSDESYWDKYDFKNETYSFEQGSKDYSLKATDTFNEVKVTVRRSTAEGNSDVPLKVEANSSIISVADPTAHFADGSYTAEITIAIDQENIVVGQKYSVNISFDVPEENLSISGENTYSLTFIVDYNWVVAGSGIWASSFTGEQFAVEFEMAEGYNGGYYCRVAPYKQGYYIPFYLDENGNAANCPSGLYDMGVTYAGAPLEFFHNPAHASYGKYCSFINQGNIYALNGLWNTAEGLYIAGEQFMWVEGWPGEGK